MKSMILEEVSNFDCYPDGRLRVGPFLKSPQEIARSLHRHGLFLSAEADRGMCSKTPLGVMISCAGSGVLGYLLDEEGLEASSSDVEMFLENTLAPGQVLTIEGHHCPEDRIIVHSSFSAWLEGGDLRISSSRTLQRKGEPRKVISRRVPAPIVSGNGTERHLSLVC